MEIKWVGCTVKNNEIEYTHIAYEYKDLHGYKFSVFNGKVHFFKIDFGTFVEHHVNFYTPEGILLPFGKKRFEP